MRLRRHGQIGIFVTLLLLLGSSVARAVPVLYDFTGTSFDGRVHAFRYTAPDFIQLAVDTFFSVPKAQLDSCTNCTEIIFSNQSALGGINQIQFNDINNSGYAYIFEQGAFSAPGAYDAIITGNNGLLVVSLASGPVPEPDTLFLLGSGLAALIRFGRRTLTKGAENRDQPTVTPFSRTVN